MKTPIALAALLIAGVVAAPALASSFDGDWYAKQLQHKGVNAIEVYEGAPGEVRAVVETTDGKHIFQYFNDETLAPIASNTGTNSRTTPQLESRKSDTNSTHSLLEDHFFD